MIVNIILSGSVEDELARETNTNIPTVIISYVAMFVYVAISLGSLKSPLAGTSFFALQHCYLTPR